MKQINLKQVLNKKEVFFLIGFINILLFHIAIYELFFLLYNSNNKEASNISADPLTVFGLNSILVLLFCLPHSFLLSSTFKTTLLKYIPQKLYSTFYSIHASSALILMNKYWMTWQPNINLIPQSFFVPMNILYVLSWIMMFWTMLSIGLFRQSGIEEWWKSLAKKQMDFSMTKKGPFLYTRHPIYLSFLAMTWTSPYLSLDKLVLVFGFTIYIIVGVVLKERRLKKNKSYRNYAELIPLLPFISKKQDNYLTQKIWSS